ncbi:MAG: RadC family protein [Bacteroidales bacterium]
MLPIKKWAEEDRPREKLLKYGARTLSNAELLAILIGTGNHSETAVELAKHILGVSQNNLQKLGQLTLKELMNVKGIGAAKAISIVAALELGKRREGTSNIENPSVTTSIELAKFIRPQLQDLRHEEFWLIMFNSKLNIINCCKIAQGGISQTTVDIRILLKTCIDNLAHSIAVAHNHPSNNLEASTQDIKLTEKIKIAANTIGINFLDHIIIGQKNYFSFADNNLM